MKIPLVVTTRFCCAQLTGWRRRVNGRIKKAGWNFQPAREWKLIVDRVWLLKAS